MRKFQKFFKELAQLRAELRGQNSKLVKQLIGDSTQNHRTLTVNQTVRYLYDIGEVNLANQIVAVTNFLRPYVENSRLESSNRTDAIDISELVNTYRELLMNTRNQVLRQKVGTILSKVG